MLSVFLNHIRTRFFFFLKTGDARGGGRDRWCKPWRYPMHSGCVDSCCLSTGPIPTEDSARGVDRVLAPWHRLIYVKRLTGHGVVWSATNRRVTGQVVRRAPLERVVRVSGQRLRVRLREPDQLDVLVIVVVVVGRLVAFHFVTQMVIHAGL